MYIPDIETDSTYFSVPSLEFKLLPLDRFCVKKHYEIGIIIPGSEDDDEFLSDLIELSRHKESITHVTFITKEDVTQFIKKAETAGTNLEFPPPLLGELKNFSEACRLLECCNDELLLCDFEAYSLKFKLIQVMYAQYAAAVREIRRRESMSRELENLAERKPPVNRNKKPVVETKSKNSIRNASRPSKKDDLTMEDYTQVELDEGDLIVDDALKNQVYFYVFKGYHDVKIMKILFKTQVQFTFVIKVGKLNMDEGAETKRFFKNFHGDALVPSGYLNNVAVLKFQALPGKKDELSLEKCLEELIRIIKSLIDLKRIHFKYLKSLRLIDTKFQETFHKFPVYDRMIRKYPLETITIPIILNCMLQEVQMKFDKSFHTDSFRNKKGSKRNTHISCPFDFGTSVRSKRNTLTEKLPNPFNVYVKDFLTLSFRTYKNLGYNYVNDNLNVLRCQISLTLAKEGNFTEDLDDSCPHTHDVCVPSDEEPCFTDDQTAYLINLLYLKHFFPNKRSTSFKNPDNEFTKNMIVFDEKKYVEKELPHCDFKKKWKSSERFVDQHANSNVYESVKPMSLHWTENLKADVLFQYLYESQMKFLCFDLIQCDITKTFIAKFHNDVDSYGLHTEIGTEYFRTPIGLADFCRFTLVDDYEWLKRNRLCPQIHYVDVVKMLENQAAMRLYSESSNQNFKNLLVPQIQYSFSDIRKTLDCPCIEENVCKILERCAGDLSAYPILYTNLDKILQELEEYKKITDFSQCCKTGNDPDSSFAVYDFGPRKFGIVGHKTDFISLDNVQVTADTTRFSNEDPKLTLKVKAEDNLFVLHAHEKSFKCHLFLADGTLIGFSKPVSNREASYSDSFDVSILDNEAETEIDSVVKQPTQEEPESSLENEKIVTSVDLDHYSSLEPYPIVGKIIRETPSFLHKTNMMKEVSILKNLQEFPTCLKVSRRPSRNFKYITKKVPENEIRISSIVKRILKNPEKIIEVKTQKRKCVIKNEVKMKGIHLAFDCSITVPNGLTIKFIPSQIYQNTCAVMQSYEHAAPPAQIPEEKYRIFTNDGMIIVGKTDGGITLMTSSGREIIFSKPKDCGSDVSFHRTEKLLDDDLIRKIMMRLMATQQSDKGSENFISRRGHLNSKRQSISSCKSFEEIAKLPYASVTMITMEGEKLTLKNQKIIKSKYSKNVSELNFQTEERIFKRRDGFRSQHDRDGSLFMEFADGTVIRTSVHINENPIRFRRKDTMGWILITSNFTYQNPYYKPVYYDNINSSIEIRICESDSLNFSKTGAHLNIGNYSTLDVRLDAIFFTKDCYHCESQYTCNISIEPLYNGSRVEGSQILLTAKDSYNKEFNVSYAGKCTVVPTYLSGAMNQKRCHHAYMTHHQNIYLINKDLSGMLLWNDKTTSVALKESDQSHNIRHYYDIRNTLIFLTITKNIYVKFDERFFGKVISNGEVFPVSDSPVVYQTTRNLYSMFELEQITGLMKCLKRFFREEVMKDLAVSIGTLKFHLKSSKFSIHSMSTTFESEDVTVKRFPVISLQEKLVELSRKHALVKEIMKSPIPNYFDSKLCTFNRKGESTSSKGSNELPIWD